MKRTYIYIILLMVFIIGCKSKNLEEIKVDEVVTESREKPTEPETIPTIEYSDDSSLSEEDVTVITPKKVNKKTNKEAPTVLKRVVYTKFNSWNLDADYFEIGFNKSIPESITEVELAKMITIKPYIKGKVTFVDRKRVRYYPNTPFHGNKMYSILVNQGELYNENIPSHSLSFYNQAPEISIESVGIKTQEDTGKNKIVLRVTSRYGKFTEERLKQNISYRIGRFSAFFSEVKYLSDGYILLETDYLEMNRNLELTIDVTASQLYISQQSRFYYRNSINEMLRMAVQEIDTDTDKSGNVSISVKFNKNLDLNQPIVGLVRVLKDNKEVSVNISKYGSKIIITGNLKRKERYEVVVEKGVKSVDYSVTQVALKQEVFTYNITSSLQYIDDGIFVPSKDGESVNVEVVNNGRIDYEVWSIDYENVSEMLHHIKLGASELKDRGYYSRETLNWYGELEYSGKEKINCEVDVPFNVKIDLSSLVNQNREKNKIYILKINGDNGHYLKLNNKRDRRYRNYGRWSKSKLLIFSDYSISAKVIKNRAIIHVANVLTNKPVSRADVSLRSSSNRVIGKGLTDRDGRCEIYDTKEKLGSKEFFVVVEKDNSTSMLASQDMLLDNTKFNLKGEYETESIKLVAFLDREKYRPGEDINVSIILRGKLNEVIEKSRAAIKVTVYNPRNVKVSSQNVKDFISGFGVYTINTTSSSMTGRWRVVVEYGAKVEQLDFKLDTFVPDKIRVILETDKKKYGSNDTIVKATVKNNYLFGAALNNAMCELSLEYKSDENFATKSYSDYSFKDDVTSVDLEDKQMLRKIVTDGNGEVEYDLPLLETSDISVPYKLHITAKTSEDGGRFVTKKMILPAHNREHFIGLRQSRYLSSNKGEYSVDIVVIDSDGEEVDSSELEYKVYGKQESWWWDYGSNYRATFKRSSSTFVVTEGEFNYNSKNKRITFTPSNGGRTRSFMVEVRFKGDSEYQMNRHYFNSYWSDDRDIAEDNIVKLTTSKPKYKIGESIALSIPATKGNVIRLSVVGGSKIIKEEILNVRKTEEYIYQLEATKEMSPNVHIEVKVLQEMIENNNDLPLRLYGIIPVMVYDPDTVLELEIDCPEQVNSQSSFKLSVDTGKKGKAQYVVSVVDEGLINKSRYRIPAIWNIFNKNRAYTAKDYDNFSMFLNSDNVEIFYNLLIGGDDFMNMESMMDSDIALSARGLSLVNALQETGVDRFKPLSLFYGVLETDENGVGVIDIDVPDYIGALKITVVAANKSAFGNAVTSVVVKDEIILVPTLPRILTPGDIIDIPLSVICDKNVKNSVEVTLDTNDLIKLIGPSKFSVTPNGSREILVFKAEVRDNIGKSTFEFKAGNGRYNAFKSIDVGVRLPRAYTTDIEYFSFEDSRQQTYRVKDRGFAGLNRVVFSADRPWSFNAKEIHERMIRYPYGCLEQITSTTFSQLLLKDFITDVNKKNEIDSNVRTYFQKIVKYNNRGLYYWPGSTRDYGAREMLNCHALHLFIVAKEKGYHTNQTIYNEIMKYLSKSVTMNKTISFSDAYRLYVLALAGKPDISTMNYINEQPTIKIDSRAFKMLELAYKISPFDVSDLRKELSTSVVFVDVNLNTENYLINNDKIDNSLDLYYSVVSEKPLSEVAPLVRIVGSELRGFGYGNTYSTIWNLIALSKYRDSFGKSDSETPISYSIKVDDKVEKFLLLEKNQLIDLTPYKGEDIVLEVLSDNYNKGLFSIQNSYVPLAPTTEKISKYIDLSVKYESKDGDAIDVTNLNQGDVFDVKIAVTTHASGLQIAVNYILPSCWEFEAESLHYVLPNLSELTTAIITASSNNRSLSKPDYVDVRDDRLIGYKKSLKSDTFYIVKRVRAVSKGSYTIPATTVEDMYEKRNSASQKGFGVVVK